MLKGNFERLDSDIINLYLEVEKIDPNRYISKRELDLLLSNLDKSNEYIYHHLLYQLVLANYNMRLVTLLIGIYNIKLAHNRVILKSFNEFFESTVRVVYSENLLKKNIILNDNKIKDILSYRIKNVHYSRRIWQNTERLGDRLYDTLTYGLDNNMSITQMSNSLSSEMGVGFSAAVRLIKTELTAVYNSSLLSYYLASGIKFVQQISTLDMRTSDICRERHRVIIPIKTAVIGENIPPLHPYCRSIIVPLY